jgi:hypothetical protein
MGKRGKLYGKTAPTVSPEPESRDVPKNWLYLRSCSLLEPAPRFQRPSFFTKYTAVHFSFLYQLPASIISAVLMAGILASFYLGHQLVVQRQKRFPNWKPEGIGPLEGALLGLLALLLSFTFSMSAAKYDTRKQTVSKEANCIGTAILRADLYPDSVRTLLHKGFGSYLQARIAYIEAGIDSKQLEVAMANTNATAKQLWQQAAALSHNPIHETATKLMIPALNEMIDVTTLRDAATSSTVPDSILWLLFLLVLCASFLTGVGQRSSKFNTTILLYGFALMTSMTVFLILDLDRPHRGLITLKQSEQKIYELRTLLAPKP